MFHRSEDCFGKRSDQKSMKYGLRGALGSRSDDVKQYKEFKYKWKKEMNAIREKHKMLCRISKKSRSHCELKISIISVLGFQ